MYSRSGIKRRQRFILVAKCASIVSVLFTIVSVSISLHLNNYKICSNYAVALIALLCLSFYSYTTYILSVDSFVDSINELVSRMSHMDAIKFADRYNFKYRGNTMFVYKKPVVFM